MSRGAWGVLVVLLVVGCGPPIGVKRLGLRSVHQELTGNVLTTGKPSPLSWIELQHRGLAERWAADPVGTLGALHQDLLRDPANRDLGFAATELSFAHAVDGGGPEYYLATTVYAWRYLFGSGKAVQLDPLDPRPR